VSYLGIDLGTSEVRTTPAGAAAGALLHIRIDAATNSHDDLSTLSHFKLATSSKVLVVRCNQWRYPSLDGSND
jgi:hypothetical protein